MKKYVIILGILLIGLQVTAFAYGSHTYLADDAGLLNDEEAVKLEELLERVSEKWDIDIVVHTTDFLGGKSPMNYTDDYYDSHGYGDDGVILMVSMAERQWWISTTGKCIAPIDTDSLGKRFTPELSAGYYYDAFTAFLDACEIAMEGETSGQTEPQPAIPLIICVLIGAAVGLIAVLVMKGQLKSVRSQAGADSYVQQGSLRLRQCTDMFLYQNTTRRAKPQNNNRSGGVHIGSSGRSHGGGGGRF